MTSRAASDRVKTDNLASVRSFTASPFKPMRLAIPRLAVVVAVAVVVGWQWRGGRRVGDSGGAQYVSGVAAV